MPGTRKLGRTSDHRKAMLRGMVTFLLENGQIETTVTRAKEVRAVAEKMITIGKNEQRSFSTRSHLSMQTETVVIHRSSRSVPAAVMLLKWLSSSL